MTKPKKVAIYARVSTSYFENVSNQLIELRATAERFGWVVSNELVDDGISGAKGRSDRPAFDRLFQMVQRKEIDVVMAWDVSRLGRSIQDLVSFMNEVQSAGVDLYIHQQAINTQTASGRMVFGIFSALASYERELIRERVMSRTRPGKKGRSGRGASVNLEYPASYDLGKIATRKANANTSNRQVAKNWSRHGQQDFSRRIGERHPGHFVGGLEATASCLRGILSGRDWFSYIPDGNVYIGSQPFNDLQP